MAGRSKVPLTWGVEHDEHRGVFLHKLVKVFIAQVINGAALICPGSLGDLGLWRLRTGRPKTGRAQSTRRGRCSPHPHWLSQPASGAPRNLSGGAGVGGTPRPCPTPSSPQEPRGAQLYPPANCGFQLWLSRQVRKPHFLPGIKVGWGDLSASKSLANWQE